MSTKKLQIIGGLIETDDTLTQTGKPADAKVTGDAISQLQIGLDTHTIDSTIHITSTERTNWNSAKTHADTSHAPSDAERNIIVGIQKNGTDVTVGSNRKINIAVPTQASDIGAAASRHEHSASEITSGTLPIVRGGTDATSASGARTNLGVYSTEEVDTKVTNAVKGLASTSSVTTSISTHNGSNIAHSDIREALAAVKEDVDTFFKDADLTASAKDTLKEIQDYITSDVSAAAEMTASIAGKSDKGHGHAISDVTGLQSALDGKAASSHGTHVSYSTAAPVVDGTASAGSASTVARSDHKHPTDTSRASKTEFDAHDIDTTKHITSTERTNWNAAKTHADSAHAPSNAEKNQNAFSNITVGSTTVAADTATDTVTFVGSNVTITPDATNDKITFTVADGSTSTKGLVQLTNSTSSTSTTTAATPNSVKSAYDLANTAKTNAATAQSRADAAYTLADGKVGSLSDLSITATATELNYVDGVTSNIQTQLDGKAASGHTHNYAGSSAAGGAATSANKVNSSLTVQLNGGTIEGTNKFTFNGSAAKSMNITASSVGAAESSHTHDDRYYTESEIDSKVSTLNTAISGKAASSHTHTIANVNGLQSSLDAKASKSVATASANGLMSSTDKSKLDGIEAGAEVNVQQDWNAKEGEAGHIKNRTHWVESINPYWDGDTTGREVIPVDANQGIYFVKISDHVPSEKDCVGANVIMTVPKELYPDGAVSSTIPQDGIIDFSDMYGIPMFGVFQDISTGTPAVGVVKQSGTIDGVEVSAGTYYGSMPNISCYISYFSALDKDEVVHKLDNKFIDAEWIAKPEQVLTPVLPQATYTAWPFSNRNVIESWEGEPVGNEPINEMGEFIEGRTYVVTLEGTTYECVAIPVYSSYHEEYYFGIGNPHLDDGYSAIDDYEDNGLPFWATYIPFEDDPFGVICLRDRTDEEIPVNVGIFRVDEKVTTLDNKYLSCMTNEPIGTMIFSNKKWISSYPCTTLATFNSGSDVIQAYKISDVPTRNFTNVTYSYLTATNAALTNMAIKKYYDDCAYFASGSGDGNPITGICFVYGTTARWYSSNREWSAEVPGQGIYFIVRKGSEYTIVDNLTLPEDVLKPVINQSHIPVMDSVIIRSITEGSTKKFRILVGDNGQLYTKEVT